MEPTTTEIIFWVIALVLAIAFFIFVTTRANDHIEITWGQRRDWGRKERRWGK